MGRRELRSLVPPTAWFGFLTARAQFELGEIAEAQREWRTAQQHFDQALRLWDHGGDAVADWRDRARAALERVARQTG